MIVAVAAAMVIAVPAWAHHSHANYKTNEWVELSGTVTEVLWMNPHVWLYMEVTNPQGGTSVWALEGGSVGVLTREGWTRDTIKVGDSINVRCHHLQTEAEGCLLGFVTGINGVAMDKEFG
jgi:hypothetical protein